RLSDGSGVELIQPLRARLGRPDLPIILLTDKATVQSDFWVSDPPATDCLTKPFSTPMLRTRVLAWLTRALAPGKARTDETISRGSPKAAPDRKSTRLNSSHGSISYAVFCLKKKRI